MKKILIVVDMQNDFIDGALGTAEAQKTVIPIIDTIKSGKYHRIFATRDTHTDAYLNSHEGRKLPVPHCIVNTEGWNIKKEIMEKLEEHNATIIDKPGFGSCTLIEKLVEEYSKDPVEFVFVGLCTDICVMCNVMMLRGALPEADIQVIAKCCAGVTPDSHQEALNTMKMCHIDIINEMQC